MIMDKPIEKVDICERGILMKKLVCVCLSLALLGRFSRRMRG